MAPLFLPLLKFVEKRANLIASLIVILNLVMDLSVILKVLFFDFKKVSNTDPLLPKTFPYLKTEKVIFLLPLKLFAAINNLSAQSFVAPYRFIGDGFPYQ